MRARFASFASSSLATFVLLAAGCGGSDPPPFSDGGDVDVVITLPPDAAEDTPDAATGTPDADPTAPDADTSAVCGNGVVEFGEQCDDNNTTPGDGCDGACQVEGATCLGTDPLLALAPDGPSVSGSTTALGNETGGSCGGASGPDQVLVMTLTDAATVTITTDLPGTDYNTSLYVRSTCDAPGSELGCASGAPLGDSLTLSGLAAGTYYVFVDGIAGAAGNFEIAANTVPVLGLGDPCDPTGMLNQCAPGLVCTGSPPVCTDPSAACTTLATAVTPPASVMGDTSGIPDGYGPGCSADGDSGELVYSVDVPAGAWDLLASVTTSTFDAIITVESTCGDAGSTLDCTDILGASGTEDTTVLDIAPGTYYILIDGYLGDAGPFTLDVALRAVRSPGDACDPTGVADRCGGGTACITDAGTGLSTCVDPTLAACSGAPAATPGTTMTGTIGMGASTLAPETCSFDAGTAEEVFYVDVPAGSYLIVEETGPTGAGSARQIYLRGPDTCSTAAELGCDSGTSRIFGTAALAAGRYYVVVDGTGDYVLNVTLGALIGLGGMCDVASTTSRCDDGTYCLGGTCEAAAPVVDMPPNAAFCDAQGPETASFVFTGDITGGTDLDNIEITLTAASTDVFAQTSDGYGGCMVNTLLDLFDAGGLTCVDLDAMTPTPIASDNDSGPGYCSQLTATGLGPGTYYLRVRRASGSGSTGNYLLVCDLT